MRHRLLPLVAVALLAAGCASSNTPSFDVGGTFIATPSPTPSPTIPNPVMGKTWNLSAITEQTPAFQGVVPPAQQPDYTANFNPDGSFLARGDCNQVFGTWTYTPPTKLAIAFSAPPIIHFCGQDSFSVIYLQALSQTESVGVNDAGMNLNLPGGTTLQFVAAPANQTPPPSASASASVEPSPSASASASPSASASASPSATPSPSATATPAASATPKPTATPAPTATAAPTSSPAPSATASATASAPPSPSSSAPAGTGLLSNPWQPTVITLVDPAGKLDFPADQRAKYVITFAPDGTFSAVVDCNMLSGTYTSADPTQATGDLTLTPGPFTAAACPPGSFAPVYAYALGRSKTYAIDATTKLLTITLTDGGTAVFEVGTAPATP